MTTFDQNRTGFGMTQFDTQENKTHDFCKRYRASIMQTKVDMIEIQQMPSPWKDLALTTEAMQQRCPAVDIRMSNNSLDTLVHDFNEYAEMQRFFRTNSQALNEYMKYKTWEALNK